MYPAWNQRCTWAEEMRRQEYAMGGTVRRKLHRQLSMAWEKWQFEAAKLTAKEPAVGGAIHRMSALRHGIMRMLLR